MAEKLNEGFASDFIEKNEGHISTLEPLFLGGVSEELTQIEVTTDEVLGKLKT